MHSHKLHLFSIGKVLALAKIVGCSYISHPLGKSREKVKTGGQISSQGKLGRNLYNTTFFKLFNPLDKDGRLMAV